MASTIRNFALASVAVITACASDVGADEETSMFSVIAGGVTDVCSRQVSDTSETEVKATSSEPLCGFPAVSEDGAYIALDECPKSGSQGRIVRVDTATGAKDVVLTYGPTDAIEGLASRGNRFYFAVNYDVTSPSIPATKAPDVHIYDWALAEHRTFTVPLPTDRPAAVESLAYLTATVDGEHLIFAPLASRPNVLRPQGINQPSELYIAAATGTAPPVHFDNLKFDRLAVSRSRAKPNKILLESGRGFTRIITAGSQGAKLGGVVRPKAMFGSPRDSLPPTVRDYPFEPVHESSNVRFLERRNVRYYGVVGSPGRRWEGARLLFDGETVIGVVEHKLDALNVRGESVTIDFDQNGVFRDFRIDGTDVVYTKVLPLNLGGVGETVIIQPIAGGEKKELLSLTWPPESKVDIASSLGWKTEVLTAPGARFAVVKESPRERFVLVDRTNQVGPIVISHDVWFIGQAKAMLYFTVPSTTASDLMTIDLETGIIDEAPSPFASATGIDVAGDGTLIQREECDLPGKPGQGSRYVRFKNTTVDSGCTDVLGFFFAQLGETGRTLYVQSELGPRPDAAGIERATARALLVLP